MINPLFAISPIDGRYSSRVKELAGYFSEAALMRYRTLIEIEWFIFLFNDLQLEGTRVLKPTELKVLRKIYERFDDESAARVKEIENTTNHDVKAIEYFIKENLRDSELSEYLEFIHFGCTSEDINNLSYSCMVRDFIEGDYLEIVSKLTLDLFEMAKEYKSVPMMSRTHGQPASPTTVGKELINVVARLETQLIGLNAIKISGKINGAVGNFNAHFASYPDVDWIEASANFIESLGLKANLYTTQIEPHDWNAEVFDSVKRINNIILDLDRDMWTYISLNFFKQKTIAGEVGSSTMPHKVNPIDFENSEGNLGIANALLEHFSAKLPVSRMQRDLTDSTVQRNFGLAFAYSVLAYKATMKGLSKCILNLEAVAADIDKRWELLAEPVQMVMRKSKIEGAYEKLKELTRGKEGMNEKSMRAFVASLDLPESDKARLMEMLPSTYIGLAVKLVESYQLQIVGEDVSGCGPSGCGGCTAC